LIDSALQAPKGRVVVNHYLLLLELGVFNRLKRRLPVACRLTLLNEGRQRIRSKGWSIQG